MLNVFWTTTVNYSLWHSKSPMTIARFTYCISMAVAECWCWEKNGSTIFSQGFCVVKQETSIDMLIKYQLWHEKMTCVTDLRTEHGSIDKIFLFNNKKKYIILGWNVNKKFAKKKNCEEQVSGFGVNWEEPRLFWIPGSSLEKSPHQFVIFMYET